MAQILIVDDSMLSRLNIKRILKNVGHDLTEATNGREALEKVVVNKPVKEQQFQESIETVLNDQFLVYSREAAA